MEADQRKTFHWSVNGVPHTLTYVAGKTTYVDEVGLRKALGARAFDRYTVRKLDRRAMEQAIDNFEVDRYVVAKFVSTKPKKAYLTHSHKEEEEE